MFSDHATEFIGALWLWFFFFFFFFLNVILEGFERVGIE